MGRDGVTATLIAAVSSALVLACGGPSGKPARKPRIVSSAPVPGSATTTAKVRSTKDGALITLRTRQMCEIVRETPFISGGWIRRKDRKPCKSRPLANAPMLFRVGNKLEIKLGNTNAQGEVTIRWATLRPRLGNLKARFGKVVVSRTSEEVATLGIASSSQSAAESAWRRAIKRNTVRTWTAYLAKYPSVKTAQAKRKLLDALVRASDDAVRRRLATKVKAMSAVWASQFPTHALSAKYQARLAGVFTAGLRGGLTKATNRAVASARALQPGFARQIVNTRTAVKRASRRGAAWAPDLMRQLNDAAKRAVRRAAAQGRRLRRKRKLRDAFKLLAQGRALAMRDKRLRREMGKVTPRLRGITAGFVNVVMDDTGGNPHVLMALHLGRPLRAQKALFSFVCQFSGGTRAVEKQLRVRRGFGLVRWQPVGLPDRPRRCKLSGSLKGRNGKPVGIGPYCWKAGGSLSPGECR